MESDFLRPRLPYGAGCLVFKWWQVFDQNVGGLVQGIHETNTFRLRICRGFFDDDLHFFVCEDTLMHANQIILSEDRKTEFLTPKKLYGLISRCPFFAITTQLQVFFLSEWITETFHPTLFYSTLLTAYPANLGCSTQGPLLEDPWWTT